MTTMNPEIKEQWLAALESGEYEQCEGNLVHVGADDKRSYCCFGVLTELAVKAGIIEQGKLMTVSAKALTYIEPGGGWESSVLPVQVQHWAGIDISHPTIRYRDESHGLAELNDGQYLLPDVDADGCRVQGPALTFPEIAALIREQF